MSVIDAFHLPGLRAAEVPDWQHIAAGDVLLRVPRLTPAALNGTVTRLHDAHRRLRAAPIERVIHAVDAVAGRLLDPLDPLRRTADALLPALTGYSAPMVRLILDHMAADWRRPQLERLLYAELGGPRILDAPVEERGRRSIAVPYPVLTHVFAGNIPGVAVTSIVRALLVRSASLGKTAMGEPLLAPLVARALAEHDALLGDALAVCHWPGGDEAIEDVAFGAVDAIVVYGGAAALADVRRRAPALTPVLDHGPRLSIGFVARDAVPTEAAARALAADIAGAVATFDQQGCVSPHAVFAEDGATPVTRLAAMIADALARIEPKLPRGSVTAEEAAAIRAARTRAEFGAFAGVDSRLVSEPDAPFSVLLHGAPAFEASCLHRTIHVHRTDSMDAALRVLSPHRALLQTAAVAGGDAGLVRRIAHTGFTRITSFPRMAWPDPAGHHDGRGPLRELLRMVALEDC